MFIMIPNNKMTMPQWGEHVVNKLIVIRIWDCVICQQNIDRKATNLINCWLIPY